MLFYWFDSSIRNIDFGTHKGHITPNWYLVIPLEQYKNNEIVQKSFQISPTFQEKANDKNAPIFNMSAKELHQIGNKLLLSLSKTVLLDSDDENLKYSYCQRTRMDFPDYITVQYVDLTDGRSTFAIYAKAKYGSGDQNVNRNRIIKFLEDMKAAVN
jgi:uncharacterized protein (DUF1499 family)